MRLEEHEQRCREEVGRPHTLAHLFLDQFFRYFDAKYGRHNAMYHRHVLHHKEGIGLIAELFGPEKGEAARLHIQDDLVPEGLHAAIPRSWDDFAIQSPLGRKIRNEVKAHWLRMQSLHNRFTVVVLGDTFGAVTGPVKRQLREAHLIIVTGRFWNVRDRNLTRKRALQNLEKYGVVITPEEQPGRWQSLRIRNHRLYFGSSACGLADSEVQLIIDSPCPRGADLQYHNNHLHVCPGYTGSDVGRKASLIRIDSYGQQGQGCPEDLFLYCLEWNRDSGTWVYGKHFISREPQLSEWDAVRISELPRLRQAAFQSFLRGRQAPIVYPDERRNFAYLNDYLQYLNTRNISPGNGP